jgi:hypothetical protein
MRLLNLGRAPWCEGAAAIVLALLMPGAAGAQSLLERWLVDYTVDMWRPRWALAEAREGVAAAVPLGVRVDTRADMLTLPALSLRRQWVEMDFGQPLGTRARARARVMEDGASLTTGSRPAFETEWAPAASAGVDVLGTDALGRWQMTVVGAWDRGPGFLGGMASDSRWHHVEITHWRSRAGPSRFRFAPDSLQDLGAAHSVVGTRFALEGQIPLGNGSSMAAGAVFHWDDVEGHDGPGDAFLAVAPAGRVRGREFFVQSSFPRGGVRAGYRVQDVDLDAPIMRLSESAGRVYYGRMEYRRWKIDAWSQGDRSTWMWTVGVDDVSSGISASVETWPFVNLWEQLGARAFRVRGAIHADAVWGSVTRTSIAPYGRGWSVGMDGGVYAVRANEEDWYVSSLGFGRSQQDSSRTVSDPVVVVGVRAQRGLALGTSTAVIELTGGLPVYAQTATAQGSSSISGYFGVGLQWYPGGRATLP